MEPEAFIDAEEARLNALRNYQVLDTPQEAAFDDLVKLAARICGTSMSLVSLVDRDRQWFKGRYGLAISETPRQISFCTHSIRKAEELMEVPDATKDPRFAENPLVREGPGIRYYAGAPLVTPEGYALGTLCVLDTAPRTLTLEQKDALQILSRQVMAQLELRRRLAELHRTSDELKQTHAEEQQRQDKVVRQRTAELADAYEKLRCQKEELLQQNRRLELLNGASRLLLAGGHPDELMPQIYRKIADYFQTSGFLEFSIIPGTDELKVEAVSGAGVEQDDCKSCSLHVGEGIAGWVAKRGEPMVVHSVQDSDDPRLEAIKGHGIRAYACYPLTVGEQLLGTLSFASTQRDEFSNEDQRFFQTLNLTSLPRVTKSAL